MQPTSRTLLAFLLAGLMAAPLHAAPPSGKAGSKASGGFKCWTNSEGVRECGNAIPPEYVQGETSTMDKQGVTIESQGRAQTAAERAAEEQRKRAEADRAAEEKRQQEARQKADQVLLSTFASEEDITMARDRKITALEGTIELTTLSIGKQQKKVDEYRTRIAALERGGKPVAPELTGDMATEQEKLDNKQTFLAAKRAEVEAIKAEYAGYLKRYRELMAQRGGK